MSSATPVDPDPMEDLLGLMEAVADRFDNAELWRSPGPKLADSMERYERVVRRFEFGRLRFAAECSVQDVAGQEAGLSTEAFLQVRLRLSPGEAKARVRLAQELVESVSISGEIVEPELPATAAAAAEGVLSVEHIQAIGQAMKQLPPAVAPNDRAAAEKFLAEQSREMDPRRVRVLARRLHAVLDPDGTLDEDKPDRRELVFRRDVSGMDYIRGRLDSEASATVQAALGAFAQPQPAQDGQPDTRSRSRRSADALVELCRRAVDDGGLPAVGGEKPHVTVTIALDDLRGQHSDDTSLRRRPGTGTLGTGPRSPPKLPGVSPATRRLFRSCSDLKVSRWISAGQPEQFQREFAALWLPAISAVSIPAAQHQPPGARHIMSSTGQMADQPH